MSAWRGVTSPGCWQKQQPFDEGCCFCQQPRCCWVLLPCCGCRPTVGTPPLPLPLCRGRDWVLGKLDFEQASTVSFFETVIRILGGLAAAHDLSGDPRLGAKAADLAERLAPAFTSSPTGALGLHLQGGVRSGAQASGARAGAGQRCRAPFSLVHPAFGRLLCAQAS